MPALPHAERRSGDRFRSSGASRLPERVPLPPRARSTNGTSSLEFASPTTISSAFDLPLGVLFTFPSPYLFAIGVSQMLSLGWDLPPSLDCTPEQSDSATHPRASGEPGGLVWDSRPLRQPPFQTVRTPRFPPRACVERLQFADPAGSEISGLDFVRFARRYWGRPCWFLFLRLVICLSSPGDLVRSEVEFAVAPRGRDPVVRSRSLVRSLAFVRLPYLPARSLLAPPRAAAGSACIGSPSLVTHVRLSVKVAVAGFGCAEPLGRFPWRGRFCGIRARASRSGTTGGC